MAIPIDNFTYISNKVRRITGRPSATQITDEEIRGYINSFLVYDLPLHTRLFYNRQTYSFQLTPNVGIYPIEAFKNDYVNFEPPAYVDGYEIQYLQDSQSFFQVYSRLKYSITLTVGTGIAGPYAGTYNFTPIEPSTAIISTLDAAGNSLVARDNGTGSFTGNVLAGATINYATGAIANLTFTAVVPVGQIIYMSANDYITGRPYSVLYFNNNFYFWPYPDRAYTFSIVAWKNPEEYAFGGATANPELTQWVDVIALGASIKIFTDNLDIESISKIQPLFDQAKRLAERRTLKQLSNQRISTIYDDGFSYPSSFWGYPYQ
jgi:hypothetical protein